MQHFYRLLIGVLCLLSFTGQAQNITKAEYFFNTDPGFGLGTTITLPTGTTTSLSTNVNGIDISSLPNGINNLFVRVKDANGNWSITNNQTFLKLVSPTISNIVAAEYFFNTDPGFGLGTTITLPTGTTTSLSTSVNGIDISSLPNGINNLFVRVKDANGNWSITNNQTFLKLVSPTISNIVAAEYFFNTDPGFGLGTTITLPTGTTTSLSTNVNGIDISSLPNGINNLFVRVKDANGNWSITNNQTFLKLVAPTQGNIIAAEYFFNNDPGFGLGTKITIPTGTTSSLSTLINGIDISSLPNGANNLFVRVKDANGNWSITNVQSFTKEVPTITSVVATGGGAGNGESVVINGSGFTGVNQVSFGSSSSFTTSQSFSPVDFPLFENWDDNDLYVHNFPDATPATTFTVVSDTKIIAVIPGIRQTPSGNFTNVYVANTSVGYCYANAFKYAMTISSFYPTGTGLPTTGSGNVASTITIKGCGFTGATGVSFGSTSAASFTVVDDYTITANIGRSTPTGNMNISVTNSNGSATLPGFTVCTSAQLPNVSLGNTGAASLQVTGADANSVAGIRWYNTYSNGSATTTSLVNVSGFTQNATSGTTVAGNSDGSSGTGLAGLFGPNSVFVLHNGGAYDGIYVADADNYRVIKFPLNATSGTAGTVVAGGNGYGTGATQIENPNSVYVLNNGGAQDGIYVAAAGNDECILYYPLGSTSSTAGIVVAGVRGTFGHDAYHFWGLNYVYVDAHGNMYTTEQNNQRLMEFSPIPAGITSSYTPPPGVVVGGGGNGSGFYDQTLNWPQQLYVDGSGGITVSDYITGEGQYNAYVDKIVPNSSCVSNTSEVGFPNLPFFARVAENADGLLSSQMLYPYGVWQDGAGNTYVSSSYQSSGNVVMEYPAGALVQQQPNGVNPTKIYNKYQATYAVDGVPISTTGATVAGTTYGSGANQLDRPVGLFVDAQGNIYITDQANNRIQKWQASNAVNSYSPPSGGIPVTNSSGNAVTIPGLGDFRAMVTNYEGCSVTTNAITITNTWTGTTSTDWFDATNWTSGVPGSTGAATIPAGVTNMPSLTVEAKDATVGSLTFGAGTSLKTGANNLIVGTNVSFDGVGAAIDGNLLINTSNSTSITGTGTVTNLVVDGASGGNLTIVTGAGNKVSVTGELDIKHRGVINTNGNLTLSSTSVGSAIFNYADYNDAGTLNGNVTVQTYIPQDEGAAFRDLGVCVNGATTGELGSQVYGYPSGSWSSVLPTNTALVPGTGTRVEVKTDNGFITLSATGTLATGNVNPIITQGAGAFTFVANPYASQLNFEALNPTATNLQDGFYYLDPTNIVGGYEGYVYYGNLTGASNTYSGGLSVTQYIQPGQGFFLQNQNNGSASSFTFKESSINNSNVQYNVFGTKKPLNRITTGLFSNGKNLDGAVVVFNGNFSKGLDKYDGNKISNHGENISFVVDSKNLCANACSLPTEKDVLPMHLYNLKTNTPYTLKLNASQFVGNGLSAYLKDSVLGTKTLLEDSNSISFTTTTDTASYSNRYSIVFNAGALPVKNINLTATALQGNQVSVKWSVEGESNVASYKVERSIDGATFTDLATVSPAASSNYSYVDATASEGMNYYRIKVTDNAGVVAYSKVVSASLSINDSRLTIYPNPITANSFKVQLEGVATGMYNLRLVNALGQEVMHKTLLVTGASSVQQIDFANKVASGAYTLKVEGNNSIYQTQVIIK